MAQSFLAAHKFVPAVQSSNSWPIVSEILLCVLNAVESWTAYESPHLLVMCRCQCMPSQLPRAARALPLALACAFSAVRGEGHNTQGVGRGSVRHEWRAVSNRSSSTSSAAAEDKRVAPKTLPSDESTCKSHYESLSLKWCTEKPQRRCECRDGQCAWTDTYMERRFPAHAEDAGHGSRVGADSPVLLC